jgi:integrase
MPADPETVALYLSDILPSFKVSTLERRVAAIRHRHQAAGLPSPSTPAVRAVIAGARRRSTDRVHRKAAISVAELLKVADLLSVEGTNRAVRDRAILLLGFACSFRRSDLAGLDLSDVVAREDRLNVMVGRSKTDQMARGRELVIPKAKRAGLCPVRAFKAWLAVRGTWSGALFSDVARDDSVTRERIDGNVVYYAIRSAARRADLDDTKFGAHSLRAGAITAAADAGADVFEIMALSGHKSVENVAMYVRRSVARYPLRKVL